jgi:hypothetical protein
MSAPRGCCGKRASSWSPLAITARASESLPIAAGRASVSGPAAPRRAPPVATPARGVTAGRVLSYQASVTATRCHIARAATLSRSLVAAAP